MIVSGVIYVNLGGYHAKGLRSSLASRASGIFVTSLYGSAAVAGYLVGWIVTHAGWTTAGEIQISLLFFVAVVLSLALRPDAISFYACRHASIMLAVGSLSRPPLCYQLTAC